MSGQYLYFHPGTEKKHIAILMISTSIISSVKEFNMNHVPWKTFKPHISCTLGDLRTKGHFADVSLVCDDQIQLLAHKMVLSACTPVLKNLLLSNPTSHPMIYLGGVKQQELQSILDFMYFGEVTVNQDKMDDILDIAKELEMEEFLHYTNSEENISIKDEKEEFIDDMRIKNVSDTNNDQNILYTEKQEEVRYFCNQCAYQATNQDALNKHKERRHGEIRHSCNQCEYQTPRQDTLNIHKQRKHGEVPYSCNQCDYQSTRKHTFKEHKERNHGGIQFSCNQCDYQSARQDTLNKHKKSKHDGLLYSCNQCNYRAAFKDRLKIHIQSKHEGIRYSCDKCEYQATQKSHLKQHQQTKHEGALYFCKQCDFHSARKDGLQAHEKSVHEGIRYSCNKCDFQATRRNYLKRHQESVHEGIKHFCKECDYQTTLQGDLKKHQRLCHNSIKEEQAGVELCQAQDNYAVLN